MQCFLYVVCLSFISTSVKQVKNRFTLLTSLKDNVQDFNTSGFTDSVVETLQQTARFNTQKYTYSIYARAPDNYFF